MLNDFYRNGEPKAEGICRGAQSCRREAIEGRNICAGCLASRRQSDRKRYSSQWAKSIERNYGITADQYWAMLEAQDGVCLICGGTNDGARGEKLYVDHCHDTGKVRGLLCRGCNHGLGHFRDSVDFLMSACAYLLQSSDVLVVAD